MSKVIKAQAPQGVHLTCSQSDLEGLLAKIERWFKNRDDVILVDRGTTSKMETGFIMIEWENGEADPWFLDVLQDEGSVDDFNVYTRSEED